jgi:hypothetical protein
MEDGPFGPPPVIERLASARGGGAIDMCVGVAATYREAREPGSAIDGDRR